MKNKLTTLLGILGLTFGSFLMVSCDDKGPAEEAGEKIDDATDDAKDAVEDAGDDAADAIDDATE